MDNWAEKYDREKDEQDARVLKGEISQLLEKYSGLSNNDLEEKAKLLEDISRKYGTLLTCLYDDQEIEDAKKEQILAEEQLASITNTIERNRIAEANKDFYIEGDTLEPEYDVDGNVKGFKREDDDR